MLCARDILSNSLNVQRIPGVRADIKGQAMSDVLNIDSIKDSQVGFNEGAQLKVIGVGGGGGNAVEHMIRHGVNGVDFICANTDSQVLARSGAHHLLQLGHNGLGAGAIPERGKEFALEAEGAIRDALSGTQMLFITAGLGGGTGTGAAPVIARVAKEMGILTVGVVTKPFDFEGHRRMKAAEQGLKELEQNVDSLIVVLNDKLLEVLGDDVTQQQAFAHANEVLLSAVGGIVNVIHVPGLINVDFEDVKTVMAQPGRAMMGTAEAAGPSRAQKAAEDAIACPLLEGIDLSGANGVLVLISASESTLKLSETKIIMNSVKKYAHPDAQVIMGTANDESLDDKLRVTVIATGLSSKAKAPAGLVGDEMPLSALEGSVMHHAHSAQPVGLRRPSEPAAVMHSTNWRGGLETPRAAAPLRPSQVATDKPAVWRNSREDSQRQADSISQRIATQTNAHGQSSGNDIEIPAFLRKQSN